MSWVVVVGCFFFQAEEGIRVLVRSRGLGDVYRGQACDVVLQFGVMRCGSTGLMCTDVCV